MVMLSRMDMNTWLVGQLDPSWGLGIDQGSTVVRIKDRFTCKEVYPRQSDALRPNKVLPDLSASLRRVDTRPIIECALCCSLPNQENKESCYRLEPSHRPSPV